MSAIRIAKDGQVVEELETADIRQAASGTPKRATRRPKTKTESGDDSSGNAAVVHESAARRSSRVSNRGSGVADTAD